MGASDVRIMLRHVLPNAVGTIITQCALSVPSVVFQEAGLSYLGLGVQAPNPSIGMLLSDGQKALLDYPFMIVSPGIVIVFFDAGIQSPWERPFGMLSIQRSGNNEG